MCELYRSNSGKNKKKHARVRAVHIWTSEPIRGKFVQLNEQHQGACFALSLFRHRTLKVMKPHNWICIWPAILLMENLPFSFSLISFKSWHCHCDYHRDTASAIVYILRSIQKMTIPFTQAIVSLSQHAESFECHAVYKQSLNTNEHTDTSTRLYPVSDIVTLNNTLRFSVRLTLLLVSHFL